MTADLSPDELQRGRELLASATPGPWAHQGWDHERDTYAIWQGKPEASEPIIRTRREKPGWDDAALIVWLRNNAEALLSGYEVGQHVREQIERLGERLDAMWNAAEAGPERGTLAELVAYVGAIIGDANIPCGHGFIDWHFCTRDDCGPDVARAYWLARLEGGSDV